MLDSNVLQPSVDWPCDLLSPANVIYRFEDLASYKTFFDSDDKPLGASWHNANFLVDAENVHGNGRKAHTEGWRWRIFDRINWIKRVGEPDEHALPVSGKGANEFTKWLSMAHGAGLDTKQQQQQFLKMVRWERGAYHGWTSLPKDCFTGYAKPPPNKYDRVKHLPSDSPYAVPPDVRAGAPAAVRARAVADSATARADSADALVADLQSVTAGQAARIAELESRPTDDVAIIG